MHHVIDIRTPRPHLTEPFDCETDDGVVLSARCAAPPPGRPLVLLCHGFTGKSTNEAILSLADELVADFGVAAFDFRGHGLSGGASTLGGREAHDVETVCLRLRDMYPGTPIIGVGFSMGAAAVLRSAGLHRSLDAVIALSAPADWRMPLRPAVVLATVLTRTSLGRMLLRRGGVNVHARWEDCESAVDVAAAIAPVPVAIVHGSRDAYFQFSDARSLYDSLSAPRTLILIRDGGHGEKLSTRATAALIGELAGDLLTTGVARPGPSVIATDPIRPKV